METTETKPKISFQFFAAPPRPPPRLAEARGFEPLKGVHPCRFSRPVHSTALPRLLIVSFYNRTGGEGGIRTLEPDYLRLLT